MLDVVCLGLHCTKKVNILSFVEILGGCGGGQRQARWWFYFFKEKGIGMH